MTEGEAPDTETSSGPRTPGRRPRRALIFTAVGLGALLVALVVIVASVVIVVGVLVTEPEGECADVRFGASAAGPAAQSPLSGIATTGARLRAALGRASGQVAYCHDFADPFVLRDGDRYYAYSTNTGTLNIPVMRVAGLFDSGRRHDALPQLPAWSKPGAVWAPSVAHIEDRYVLYYATTVAATGAQCLSHATATTPDGPFVDDSKGPWICPKGGGAIDASPFAAADGRRYLVWRHDNGFSGIVGAELSADGLEQVSPMQRMLTPSRPWEARTIEGPSLAAASDGYFLFYSGGDWRSDGYAIGVARCTSPLGPCTKLDPSPWIASTAGAAGPGGQELFQDGQGRDWMVLHAWVNAKVGYPDGARGLFVVPVTLSGPTPTVG